MNQFNFAKFLTLLVIFSALFFASVCFWANINLFNFLKSSHRILNVRNFDQPFRLGIIEYFIKLKHEKNYDLLVLGDSQPWGHDYSQDKIFSYLIMQKMNSHLGLNLAFQDGRNSDIILILKFLAKNNIKTNNLVISFDEAHVNNVMFRINHLVEVNGLYEKIFFFLPRSINVAIKKENLLTNQEDYKEHFYKDHFAQLDNQAYHAQIEGLFKLAKSVSDNIIVYITPHPPNAVKYLGYDFSYLNKFYDLIYSKCEKNKVRCLHWESGLDKKYFFDMVHLNSAGHKYFSDYLYQYLVIPKN